MGVEIPIYSELDEIYLYKNEKYFYNRESGEIFFLGKRLDKIIEDYSFLDIIYSLYTGRLGEINIKKLPNSLRILIRNPSLMKLYREELFDRLLITNMYNGYSMIHNAYLILRMGKMGFLHTYKSIGELGSRRVYRRYIEYLRWKSDPNYPIKSNVRWKGILKSRLPFWQDFTRKWILEYIKEKYPDKYPEFKLIDKRYKNYVRVKGYSDIELYQFMLCEKVDIGFRDIILLPKLIMAELIYLDYFRKGGKEIILPPLYTGVLRQCS